MPLLLSGLLLRRAPQGARGLKCVNCSVIAFRVSSRPARGAWVEIRLKDDFIGHDLSRPARGAWVEILYSSFSFILLPSRPARGAWVEILLLWIGLETRFVAPRKGRVG